MAGVTYIRGLAEVEVELNKQIALLEKTTMAGMMKSAAFIRNDTERTPTKTPADYWNLVSSWFVVTAAKAVPADKFTKGFKDNPVRKISAGTFASWHSAAITEGQSLMKTQSFGRHKTLMMGYSAHYAAAVHENIGAKNWTRGGSGPKWLEESFKRNAQKILQIIKESAEIKR
jgi:hypothetical protein